MSRTKSKHSSLCPTHSSGIPCQQTTFSMNSLAIVSVFRSAIGNILTHEISIKGSCNTSKATRWNCLPTVHVASKYWLTSFTSHMQQTFPTKSLHSSLHPSHKTNLLKQSYTFCSMKARLMCLFPNPGMQGHRNYHTVPPSKTWILIIQHTIV